MSHRRPIGSERKITAFTNPVNCSILHRCYYSSLPWILNFLLSLISSHHCHFWTFSYFVLIPISLSFLHSDHPQLMLRLSDTFCLAISFLRFDHPPCFDFQLLSVKSDRLSSVRSSCMSRLSIELISAKADKLRHVYLLAQLIFLVSDWSIAFLPDWLIVFARKIESTFILII